MPDFVIAPPLEGYITCTDLLTNEGTFSFQTNKDQLKSGGLLFKVQSDDFIFAFSIQNESLVLQRNEVVSVLTTEGIPEKSFHVFVIWSYSELKLLCVYGSGDSDIKEAVVETKPITPPNSLINWARKKNLIPVEEYPTEAEFRNKVHSCLLSIQTKIDESGAYYQFWNISYSGQKITDRKPKNEIEVQPFIHSILSDQFLMSSIEIIPEFNSGVGNLDFLFIAKIKNDGFAYFAAEFKNAHSNKLEDGLLKQLPAYMENKGATYGAYCVLDYRGKWFNKPESLETELDIKLDKLKSKSNNPHLGNVRVFPFSLSKPKSASKK